MLIVMFSFLTASNALISFSSLSTFGVVECCGDCCLYVVPGEVTINTLQPAGIKPYFQDFVVVDVSFVDDACYVGDEVLRISSKAVEEGVGEQFISITPQQPSTINFSDPLYANGYAFVSTQITVNSAPMVGLDQLRFYKGDNICGAIPITIAVGETNNGAIGFNPLRSEFLNASVNAISKETYSISEERGFNSLEIVSSLTQNFIYVKDLKLENPLVTILDMNLTEYNPISMIVPPNNHNSMLFSMIPGEPKEYGMVHVSLNEIQTDRGVIKIPIVAIVYPESLSGLSYVIKSVPEIGVLGFVLIGVFSLIIVFFVGRKKKLGVD